ncbi:MAG: hypothetical protein RLZ32_2899, partial [Gemmatimonadota bacterium]
MAWTQATRRWAALGAALAVVVAAQQGLQA